MAAKTFSIVELLTAQIEAPAFRKSEKARFRLMKAVAELLDDRPFTGIRNVDICRQAGLAAGMLNTYFEDKHDLVAQLLTIFAEHFERTHRERAGKLAADSDVYVRIYDKIDYIVATCEKNPGIYRLLILESPELPALKRVRQSSFRFWIEDLASMLPDERAGMQVKPQDKREIAAMLSGMVDEAMRRAFFGKKRLAEGNRHHLVEMLALLRYSAMFGRDPDPDAVEDVRWNVGLPQ